MCFIEIGKGFFNEDSQIDTRGDHNFNKISDFAEIVMNKQYLLSPYFLLDFLPVFFQLFLLIHHNHLHIIQITVMIQAKFFLNEFFVLSEVICYLDDKNQSIDDFLAIASHVVV